MPVEIRELVIRAVVAPEVQHSAGQQIPPEVSPTSDQGAIIQACVREVLRILKRQKDR